VREQIYFELSRFVHHELYQVLALASLETTYSKRSGLLVKVSRRMQLVQLNALTGCRYTYDSSPRSVCHNSEITAESYHQ
jgi:hypothetical protein